MNNPDGWIIIGTKLDNKQLQKDLIKSENELRRWEKQASKLTEKETRIKAKIEIDRADYKRKIKELNAKHEMEYKANTKNGFIQNQEGIDLKYDQLRESLDMKTAQKMDIYNMQLDETHKKMEENTKEQERLNEKIATTRKELEKSRGAFDLKGTIDNVGNSIQKVTKKIIHWGLAIFGVRSAYLFVRQAMSTLSQYNEQLSVNLQYIRFVLATALEPLILKIVQLAYELLSIVGTIINRLTGYNIFKNSGVDKFQKSLDKSSGSAKELKKQLAGFDEMNVLNDNTGGGGGSNQPLPDMGLSANKKLPKWMDLIIDNFEELLPLILGVVGALKLLEKGFSMSSAVGFGLVIAGIVYAIIGLIKYLKDPSFENFGQVIEGIGVAVIGLGLLFLGLPGIIAGVFVLIVGIIARHWDTIKKLFDTAVDWLTKKMEQVKERYGFFAGLILQGIRDQVRDIRDYLDTIFKNAKSILDNIISFVKNVFAGNWKGAWENVKNIALNVFEMLLANLTFKIKTIKNVFVSAFGVIGDIIGGIIKGAINVVFRMVENRINEVIWMFNGVVSVINKLPGVSIGRIRSVSLPRLASGGIVNYPSKGVPIGNAITGERGSEGVIPLTDSQQMELLGQSIGKYITLNATIVNSMNGRILSKELQKIQNQTNFATNGRWY